MNNKDTHRSSIVSLMLKIVEAEYGDGTLDNIPLSTAYYQLQNHLEIIRAEYYKSVISTPGSIVNESVMIYVELCLVTYLQSSLAWSDKLERRFVRCIEQHNQLAEEHNLTYKGTVCVE